MMKSRLFAHYGRLAFRAVVTGGVLIDVAHTECRPSVSTNRFYAAVSSNSVNEHDHKVHTSCCGFPKNLIGGASMVLDQGVIGEDACFIARINNTYVVGKPFIDVFASHIFNSFCFLLLAFLQCYITNYL